jgi:urease accessory protein
MPVVPFAVGDAVENAMAGTVGEIAPGTGRLEFTTVRGRTALTRALATSPLKLLCPRQETRSASVYLANFGGGLVGGDHIDLSLTVGPDAAALVATQASTKIYRSSRGSSQSLDAEVGRNGLLVLLPDPVVCFAGASYRQDQRIRLDDGANLVLVDRLTAGRVEYGERWRFDEYASRILVWHGERLLLHDALRLTRREDELARRLDRFNCLTTIVLVGRALVDTAGRLQAIARSRPVTRRSDFFMSAAPLVDDGILVRLAGRSVEAIDVELRGYLDSVKALLGVDPWVGK